MKLRGKVLASCVALAAAVLLGLATGARAQARDFRGSFTVTHQLQWDKITLAPGEYRLHLSTREYPMVTISTKEGAVKGFAMSRSVTDYKGSGAAALVVVTAANEPTVHSLLLPEQGIELTFRPDLELATQGTEQTCRPEEVTIAAAK